MQPNQAITSNGYIFLALTALTTLNIQGGFKGWVELNQSGRNALYEKAKKGQKSDPLNLTK